MSRVVEFADVSVTVSPMVDPHAFARFEAAVRREYTEWQLRLEAQGLLATDPDIKSLIDLALPGQITDAMWQCCTSHEMRRLLHEILAVNPNITTALGVG